MPSSPFHRGTSCRTISCKPKPCNAACINQSLVMQPFPLPLTHSAQLQALVYSIIPPTTAINDYATGLNNKQQKTTKCQLTDSFWRHSDGSKFVTDTQIIPGTSVITTHVDYTRPNKTKIIWIETKFFLFWVWARLMLACMPGCYVASTDGHASCLRACLDATLLPQMGTPHACMHAWMLCCFHRWARLMLACMPGCYVASTDGHASCLHACLDATLLPQMGTPHACMHAWMLHRWARLMLACMPGCYVASTVLLVPKPFGGPWQHQWCNQF